MVEKTREISRQELLSRHKRISCVPLQAYTIENEKFSSLKPKITSYEPVQIWWNLFFAMEKKLYVTILLNFYTLHHVFYDFAVIKVYQGNLTYLLTYSVALQPWRAQAVNTVP
jgi:hypothetical protein